MKNKICNTCGIEKKIDSFYSFFNNKYKKNYYGNKCKVCLSNDKTKYDKDILKTKFSPNYIYILKNKAWKGYLKIGRAKDPQKRLNSYQTSSPHRDFEIVYFKKLRNVYIIEKYFELNYQKTSGEWIFETEASAISKIEEIIAENDLELTL